MTPIDRIRALVGRHQLGYYFNPGGCEFFSPAHPAIPHCQTGEYGDEEDAAKLEAWVNTHLAALTAAKPPTYVWYSEGQFPVRVINGRVFHRCTLACQVAGEGGKPEEWEQEFDDIEELEDGTGWRLRCVTRDEGPTTYVTIKPETLEARAEWEASLFTDSP